MPLLAKPIGDGTICIYTRVVELTCPGGHTYPVVRSVDGGISVGSSHVHVLLPRGAPVLTSDQDFEGPKSFRRAISKPGEHMCRPVSLAVLAVLFLSHRLDLCIVRQPARVNTLSAMAL